ncbi:MAG: hypothetical protein DRJ40_02605 [Thermoprotei archaeon]|nr:MAG: hypothetical protein DRJ40_02605 [Thermoprotei archaeon]
MHGKVECSYLAKYRQDSTRNRVGNLQEIEKEEMAVDPLLKVDIKSLLRYIERICDITLPEKVAEISLVPEYSILHIRFREPTKYELGEPIHPLIHLYRDSETKEITAVDV